MEVLLFGRLADRVGRRLDVAVASGGCSVAELRALLSDRHPALAEGLSGGRVRACVGDVIVSDDHHLDEGAAVEFFPPVSGG